MVRYPFFTTLAVILISATQALCASPDGRSGYYEGRFDDAVESYRAAAKDGRLKASLDLAVLLKDLGRYEEAAFALRRAQGKNGDDPAILSLLARLYYLNNYSGQALKVLEQVNWPGKGDVEACVLAGLCYEALGDEEKARQAHERAITLDKNNVISRLSLAQLYYRQDRLKESEEHFKKLNIIDASISKVYGCWGEVLFRLGNYREAFRVYGKMRLIDPRNESVNKRLETVREKLGEGFFREQREKTAESRKAKTVTVQPARTSEKMKSVRVGILSGFTGTVRFKCPVPVVMTGKEGVTFTGEADGLYTVESGEGRVSVSDEKGNTVISSRWFRAQPVRPEGCLTFFALRTGGGNFWAELQDRSFRGAVEVSSDHPREKGFTLVNVVTLEEYLFSVVPSEMPSSWPLEALKAQAVAARSEAMSKLGRHKKEGFDFCAEVHCQAYFGAEKETRASRRAVEETFGVIMTHAGKPVDAVYSSTCGGHTQDNIFGEGSAVPYLKGRSDTAQGNALSFPLTPYELETWLRQPPDGILCDIPEYLNASSFRWVRVYSADEFKQLIARKKPLGAIRKVLVTRRNKSGHVEKVRVQGSEGSLVIEKELAIRKALGDLRSGLFKVEMKYGRDKTPEQFIFYGGGWGHGVGMCQAGACGLALRGKDYKEILRHYYDRIELEQIY